MDNGNQKTTLQKTTPTEICQVNCIYVKDYIRPHYLRHKNRDIAMHNDLKSYAKILVLLFA